MSATHVDRFYHATAPVALPRLRARLDLLEPRLHRRRRPRSPGSGPSPLATLDALLREIRQRQAALRPARGDAPSSPATRPAATASGSIATSEHQGVENLVVDAASIEVNRRKRRAKSDRLDVAKLVTHAHPLASRREEALERGPRAARPTTRTAASRTAS